MTVSGDHHANGRSFDQYLAEIENIPQLSAKEERTLVERAAAGDEAAQHALVRHNLRFVISRAKRLRGRGLALEDLVAEGNVGLWTAAQRVDPSRGVKFISYAVWLIDRAMFLALARHGHAVRLPPSQIAAAAKVLRYQRSLRRELDREPTTGEVAEVAGLALAEVERVVEATRTMSLDEPVGEGKATAGDMLAGEAAAVDEVERRVLDAVTVAGLLARLPAREAFVVRRSFGLDGEAEQTLEEIGAALGITRQRAQQLRERALERMRGTAKPPVRRRTRRWGTKGRVVYQRRGMAPAQVIDVAASACA